MTWALVDSMKSKGTTFLLCSMAVLAMRVRERSEDGIIFIGGQIHVLGDLTTSLVMQRSKGGVRTKSNCGGA